MSITLKNVAKTWEVDVAKSMKDRNVLIPPLRTAGPILFKAWTDLSCLVPKIKKYITKYTHLITLKLTQDILGWNNLKTKLVDDVSFYLVKQSSASAARFVLSFVFEIY